MNNTTVMAESSNTREHLYRWIISAAGIVVLLVHLVSSFAYSNWSWGFHHFFFLPRAWTYALVGIGCVLCLPPVWSRLVRSPAARSESADQVRRASTLQDLLIAGGCAVAFWLLRMPLHFLGDGRLLIRLLDQGFWFHPHEPLDRMIHAGVLWVGGPLFGWNGEIVYALLSTVAGFVYVFAALRLGALWGHRWFVTAFLVTLGTVQLFFGYAESYSLATAMILVYFLLALEYLTGRRRLVWVGVALLVGIALHFVVAFLVPSFLYLLWGGTSIGPTRSIRRLVVGVAVSLIILAALVASSLLHASVGVGLLLVPLFSHPVAQYTLLSWEHAVDFLNEQVLVSPLGWIAAASFLVALWKNSELRRWRPFGFLLCASAFPLLFNLLLRPGLGGSRDWDLWSMGSLPYAIVAALWIARGLDTKRVYRGAAWILIVVGLIHVIPWVALNQSHDLSLDRFDRMLEANPLWTAKRAAAARAELAGFYFDQYAWADAAHHFEKAVSLDAERARYWGHLGTSYLMLGRLSEAENRIRRAVELDPEYAKAYYGLAQVYLQQGRIAEAEIGFRRAAELDPRQSSTFFNLGNLHRARGELGPAIDAYRRAVELDPGNILYWYELARTLDRNPVLEEEAMQAWTRVQQLSGDDPADRARYEEATRRLGTVRR
jgi:tetratricopeptide (TPR) repeat protein